MCCDFAFVFSAANLSVSCPADVSINANETHNVSCNVTHSLPATLYVSPLLGNLSASSTHSTGTEYIMTLMANDARLVLDASIQVVWNVAYDSARCSGDYFKPEVEQACQAISTTASCTTNVYTFRKSPLISLL